MSGSKSSRDIGDEKRRTYAAMMSAMDDAIGEVLDELREKKLEDNTLVFFISDNGGPTMPGTSINASRNDPLRGSKRTTLEGGIRVPFFVKWPGHVPAGKVYDQPVIQLDILPTALAAAGVRSRRRCEARRRRFAAVSQRQETPARRTTRSTGDSASKWRFATAIGSSCATIPSSTARRARATDAKLYNLANDIGETHRPDRREPEKAKALQAAWDKWNELNVPPLWGDGGVDEEEAAAKARARRKPCKNRSRAGRRIDSIR